MKSVCILLVTMICLLGTSSAQRASKSRLVGNLLRHDLVGGCGCYFEFRGRKRNTELYMFFEGIEENYVAWMNINGKDVPLKLVKERHPGGRESVGSRWPRTFAADDISVTTTFITTRVCDPNDEGCESHDYDATFVVRKGQRVQTVKAVGSCGC